MKRARENENENNDGAGSSEALPDYFNPAVVPTVHNVELKLLIGQLRERFVQDLRRIEGELANIVENGGGSPTNEHEATDVEEVPLLALADMLNANATTSSSSFGVHSPPAVSSHHLTTEAKKASNSNTTDADDDGVLLTAEMLFGGATDTGDVIRAHDAVASRDQLDPPLDVLIAKIQQGLRSRAKAMVMIDMVLQLQQERNEMLRMRAHMLRALESAEGLMRQNEHQ